MLLAEALDLLEVLGSVYQNGFKYSTTVPSDPDTHEDFRPANKVQGSAVSLKDVVEQDVKENPVMIYMKGVPDFPQCGFSSLAVRVLKQYSIPLSARNILEDPELKNAVKTFRSHAALRTRLTCIEFHALDIKFSFLVTGELKDKLKDVAASPKSE
ncbi:hypothetical protein REPUB_Repub13aG0162700 [Reevesia pubescens]